MMHNSIEVKQMQLNRARFSFLGAAGSSLLFFSGNNDKIQKIGCKIYSPILLYRVRQKGSDAIGGQ